MTSVGTSLPELRAKARKQMDEAIEAIPMERKADYLLALEKAPYLFENETDPLMFLRCCDYNLWEAADRIVLYWKERTEIFGPDRAYLPLVLTGDGALNEDDVLSMQAGYPAMMPKAKSGHSVIYVDRRMHLPHLSSANRLRTLFYIAHKLAEDELSQTEGVIVLYMLVTPRLNDFDANFVNKCSYLGIKVFPLKGYKVHFLSSPPKQKNAVEKRYLVQDFVQFFVNSLIKFGYDISDGAVDVLFDRGGGEVFEALVTDGVLLSSSVPRDFGGTWDQNQAVLWCREQASIERVKYKWLLQAVKEESLSLDVPEQMTEEDKEVQKRAINAVNSRRKRARKREHIGILKEQHRDLASEQESLKAENARLESLLKQALTLATGHNATDSPDGANLDRKVPARPGRTKNAHANSMSAVEAILGRDSLGRERSILAASQQETGLSFAGANFCPPLKRQKQKKSPFQL